MNVKEKNGIFFNFLVILNNGKNIMNLSRAHRTPRRGDPFIFSCILCVPCVPCVPWANKNR